MTLPITYADGGTIHGADVDSWTATVNALTAFIAPPGATLVSGYTTTVTSGSTLTLTVSSTTMQVLTGSTAQLVTLPTTSVVAGAVWIISNQSSALTTVQSSGANTVTTVPAGDIVIFAANTATPTTAAGWAYETCTSFPVFATTATAAGTTTLNATSPQVQVFTGSTTQTVTLPTTNVPAGAQWMIINQSTGAVTVNGSSSGTAVVLAGGTSAVLTSSQAAPTTGAQWGVQYGGVNVASGTVLTGPAVSGTIVAPPAAVTAISANVNPTTASTKILSSNVIPISTLAVGSTFRLKAQGVGASVTSSLTMSLYMGTGGLTSDVLISTTTATVTSNVGYSLDGLVTIRSTGATGTVIGACRISAGGSIINHSVTTLTQTVNTTVANYVTLAQTNSTNTSTVTVAVVTWAGA